jgi:hypothetical protein
MFARYLAVAPIPRPRVRRPAAPQAVHWWTDQHVWLQVLSGAALVAVVGLGACLLLRFVLPVLLRTMIQPIQEAVTLPFVAVLAPEFLVTSTLRAVGRPPLRIAYDFGDLVSWTARFCRSVVYVSLSTLARAARASHPAVTAVLFGGLALGRVVGRW